MQVKLTDLAIQSFPNPEKGNVKYWDTVMRGFGVRATSRSKSFFVVFGKERNSRTLGKYPSTSLKTARREAQKVLADSSLISKGETPLKSFTEARDLYLKQCGLKLRPKTFTQYTDYLNRYEFDSLTSIRRSSINLDAPHEIASWKAFMNWCIRQEYIDRNPFASMRTKTGSRDRVLSDEEVKLLWAYDFPPFSNIIKLLLLTGLRRMEVMHLQVIGDNFVLAPEHTKNGQGHTLPASDWAKSYAPIPTYNGWSKAKARVDKNVKIPHWTLHDLRRTFATIHARIASPLHVIEAMLNHTSGEVSGLKAVYIRHNYLQEAKIAIANYEKELQSIVV